jgi:hypothetical protein
MHTKLEVHDESLRGMARVIPGSVAKSARTNCSAQSAEAFTL